MVLAVIEAVYRFLWGDLFTIPIGNGNGIGIPLLVLLLIPTGIYFTIRTKFLPVRLFPDMIRALGGKKKEEGRSVTGADLVCVDSDPCGNGESRRSCRCDLCGRCGSRVLDVDLGDLWFLHGHLWRQPWRIYTKKKIRSTADITAVRLIISTAMRSA